jgi:adenosylcobinamide kinase/adenosylcobinamide-phosphate guanylyltransferase
MSNRIIFIIGGARSGKSSFALNEASKIKGQKAYVATAEALDSEMRERIEEHKKNRGDTWNTFEEPLKISEILKKIKGNYKVIIIDCMTLWLSNILHRIQTPEKEVQRLIKELKAFKNSSLVTRHSSLIFIVSNEVGMGIVPDNRVARGFRDLAGFLNQKVAEIADEVYLVTAGIPVRIKSST